MGQRLVIDIRDNEKVLANAYYHWSGYTGSAIELTNQILDNIDHVNPEYTDIQKAVWLLYKTGARFNEKECYWMGKQGIDIEPFEFAFDGHPIDRNEGLVCVSEKGETENVTWEEAHVDINILTKEVCFYALNVESKDEYQKEVEEGYYPAIEEVQTFDIPDELEFSYDEWQEFAAVVLDLISEGKYQLATLDRSLVYIFIE